MADLFQMEPFVLSENGSERVYFPKRFGRKITHSYHKFAVDKQTTSAVQ